MGVSTSVEEESVLRTEGLTRRFGGLTAVNDVDIDVPQEELHSIIGPNGAGKTTFFRLITGELPPSDGQIFHRAEEVTERSMDYRSRNGISRAYQITQLFSDLTIRENLRLAAQSTVQNFNPLAKTDPDLSRQADGMIDRMGIEAGPETTAAVLAHGDKKKLEMGMSLIVDPDLLLLDEPTSGVSETESGKIIDLLEEETADMTVLMIEHDVDMVLELSDRITVLNQGAVIERGTPEVVENSEAVQEAYLEGY